MSEQPDPSARPIKGTATRPHFHLRWDLFALALMAANVMVGVAATIGHRAGDESIRWLFDPFSRWNFCIGLAGWVCGLFTLRSWAGKTAVILGTGYLLMIVVNFLKDFHYS
jgi:hypothetical protein